MSNSDDKSTRKFIGIILKKGKYNYVVPFSSPKFTKDYEIKDYTEKKLPSDFSFGTYKDRIVLLRDTTEPVVFMYSKDDTGIDFYGKILCNDMIPAPESELIKLNINEETDAAYKALLQKQINYVRKNEADIIKKHINPVYNNKIHNRTQIGYIRKATLNFKLLELKCDEWEKAQSNSAH